MKPKLLVLELWGLGDLALATPFLQAATPEFGVTLLAKPFARDLQKHCWPDVTVRSFTAPWTRFRGKYRFFAWPWPEMLRLQQELKLQKFDVGVSARRDPRDHILLGWLGVKKRLGFSRFGSQVLLTEALSNPAGLIHRYEYWRILANTLDFNLPPIGHIPTTLEKRPDTILVHSGAGQPVRVWPLDRYQNLVTRLRDCGYSVQVVADPDQLEWWQSHGERSLSVPRDVSELITLCNQACMFIGNDSGPGHLAAILGLPTLSIFGPQLPGLFRPLNEASAWIEGKPCPYKPCFDYCRFSKPFCLHDLNEDEVWVRVEQFLRQRPFPCRT